MSVFVTRGGKDFFCLIISPEASYVLSIYPRKSDISDNYSFGIKLRTLFFHGKANSVTTILGCNQRFLGLLRDSQVPLVAQVLPQCLETKVRAKCPQLWRCDTFDAVKLFHLTHSLWARKTQWLKSLDDKLIPPTRVSSQIVHYNMLQNKKISSDTIVNKNEQNIYYQIFFQYHRTVHSLECFGNGKNCLVISQL